MGTVYINERCKKILSILVHGEGYVSLDQIAKEIKVSRRSIYYDLCKINEWLSYYGIKELESVRGKGIHISKKEKEKIETIFEDEHEEESYIFSPSERVKVIYCYILIMHLSEDVHIEQLAEFCQVSRNTIFNDLKVLTNQINEYNLTLEYEKKNGYKVSGDVVNIRAMFFMFFNTLLPLANSGVLTFLNQEPIMDYKVRLEKIAEELKTEYVEGVLLSLAALVPLMYKGARRPYFPTLERDKIEHTQEYRLVGEYFPDLYEEEHIYMCLHLLGSRVSMATIDMFDDATGDLFNNTADQSVYEITKSLVSEFEKIACVIFEEKEELERALFIHIKTSLYRYQYGIQIGNPIAGDVMREYPNLFDITRIVSKYLEQLVGLPIPDGEVAYLALHFGAHLKIARSANEQLRILIVCVNGLSTGNMLKREVQKLLPEAKIVDVVSTADISGIQDKCDLIVSTVKIKSVLPVVTVHPILTELDRKTILTYQKDEKNNEKNEAEAVFHIVKKYVKEKDYPLLKEDLRKFYQEERKIQPLPSVSPDLGLTDYLTLDKIKITDKVFRWQEAIRYAGKKLLESGSIEKSYIEKIISEVHYYGPYMFVTQGLALAHAKPEDGANRVDVSMTVFKEPVKFSKFYEAKIIMVLAIEDQEKHLKILKDIMDVFEAEEAIDQIVEKNIPEDILKYLEEKCE